MNWYYKALLNYSDFKGRSRRKEFWMFYLFNIIFVLIAIILDNVLGTTLKNGNLFGAKTISYGYIYLFYVIIIFIPHLAVSVRRLHDVGKSGFMLFTIFVPIIGIMWIIYLDVKDSDPGINEYGFNPKKSINN